ncbi:GNAT family N-acetyltransferase [Kitasatospora sp. NPDC004799]|uniref:GNAT family N-acetyltransferase n=1 Tax=Kitasatospora sp. NPDC004799 TaxID=3154460 RepID=UPI0033A09D3B
MPTAPPAPRAGFPQRVRMHAGYHWRNSGNPLVTGLRDHWDTRRGAVFPSVRSDLAGLSVGYSGLKEGLAYTLEFTELRREGGAEQAAARRTGQVTGRQLRTPEGVPDADIAIVGTSASLAHRMPKTASLVIPMRVHFVIDFDGSPDRARQAISKRERQKFNSDMRRHGWGWELNTSPAWFDEFYDRLYRPTMFERHGARERTETKDAAYECLFRTGRMFVLTQDGERIGGALCHWDEPTGVLTLRLLGVRGGDAAHYESGAFKAIYHLLIGWCAENGVRRLDFQGTEPFLSKGTFQWKRRFGTRVIMPPNHFGDKRLWLRARRDTPEVRDYLVANPTLAETADGLLEAVYFHDGQRPPRLDFSAKAPGVDRVRQVDLDAFFAR